MTWYIAITNPNCQNRASSELASLGYRSFCPKLKKWVRHARAKIAKEYPILGRYVFVEIPDGRFWVIRNVNGVKALLTKESGEPQSVPEQIVWAFRERYMQGEWDFVANETGEFTLPNGETMVRKNPIPTGAIVRIMEGEFANMLAVVRGRERGGKLKTVPRGQSKLYFTREGNVRAA